MKKYKMLFAGESWLTHNMEVKGWDDFSVGGYGTEIDRIHAAMDEFAEITHLPSHLVECDAGSRQRMFYAGKSVSPTAYSSWRTM